MSFETFSPFISFLVTAIIGGVAVFLITQLTKVGDLPELKEIKEDYPILNSMLYFLEVGTDDATLFGQLAKSAYLLYNDKYELSEEEAIDKVKAVIAHFDKGKYSRTIGLDLENLDPKAVEQGKKIARELLGAEV